MFELMQSLRSSLQRDSRQLLADNPTLDVEVDRLLARREDEWQQQLKSENPFGRKWTQLEAAERALMCGRSGAEELRNDSADFNQFMVDSKQPNRSEFWEKEIDCIEGAPLEKRQSGKVLHRLLLSEWKKNLQRVENAWQESMKRRWAEDLQKQMEQWLQQIGKMSESLSRLGLDPADFLDMSDGVLNIENIESLKKSVEFMEKDYGVQKLCELLGRLRQAEEKSKLAGIKRMKTLVQEVYSKSSREEIVGLKLSNEVQYAIHSELALLSDSDISVLFDLKLLESRLLCFEMAGIQKVNVSQEIEEPDEEKGPMVLCIDTSGSMSGAPEKVAKSISLFIAKQALKEKRACYLISFSDKVETLELTGSDSLSTLLSFLKMPFDGWTDVEPAISYGLEVMQRDEYKNSDMLIISDFILDDLEVDLVDGIKDARSSGNKFYSLCVGEYFLTHKNREYFDREWIYDPEVDRVEELLKVSSKI